MSSRREWMATLSKRIVTKPSLRTVKNMVRPQLLKNFCKSAITTRNLPKTLPKAQEMAQIMKTTCLTTKERECLTRTLDQPLMAEKSHKVNEVDQKSTEVSLRCLFKSKIRSMVEIAWFKNKTYKLSTMQDRKLSHRWKTWQPKDTQVWVYWRKVERASHSTQLSPTTEAHFMKGLWRGTS